MNRPELIARAWLRTLGIKTPNDLSDLELIAAGCGATVVHRRLTGAEARVLCEGKRAIISIDDRIPQTRRRFALAHELGHMALHKDDGITTCTSDDLKFWLQPSEKAREAEANQFAVSLLLPSDLISDVCRNAEPTFDFVTTLATNFSTSVTCTALRFVSFTEEPVAIVSSTMGIVDWFRPSQAFAEILRDCGFFLPTKVKLGFGTLAHRFYRGMNVPAMPQKVMASAWLEGRLLNSRAHLVENTIVMPSYDSTLSLLWVDEDIEIDSDLAESDDNGFVHSWMRDTN